MEIEKPIIEILDMSEDKSYAKISIEPLERGYGTTLGNSMRRVLLSSLPGSSISNIRIQGVLHEFSTIEGVYEDVPEIILNIKNLAIKSYTKEPQKLLIDVKGPKEVTGADIITGTDCDIINKDLKIATVNKNGHLVIEMDLTHGRGYVLQEKNKEALKESTSIGDIPIDSEFTPVKKVNFKIENTRVGQITDYDRLVLEIWTNGTINADEAASLGARILIEHLSLISGLCENMDQGGILKLRDDRAKQRYLKMSIEELDLSVRSFNSLKRANINTVAELTEKSEDDMLKVRNLGRKSLEEVINKLAEYGLSLKETES
ncbi:DNA-directed RNA polymerase subunit alpha [Ezakiella coagulans]|uniref:DNA-directed RNA polymerase subunit alpha n=1 Tax=Ezakiella coagulans TaxID=46507 RepID=A0A2U1E6V1_9FIRM|nr:DNA-directed RNA polymerase subunit alpha [Ezakiella coagulans]PVY95668.1 DNA-directed RNA polymerase subunit alpha [Ezakiella coagulans]UQK61328.1 DNA-directed RNA polymerase subunit alpha [Ezakiella coagulans]